MSEHENPHEKTILSLKKTRKAFLIEYGCGFLLLLFLAIFAFKGIYFKPLFAKAVIGLALFSMLSAEYARLVTRYKITDAKISAVKGIIKQFKKNIYFAPLSYLPNINFHQNRLQRLLGYGTITISGIPEEGVIAGSFEIKDINNPQKVLYIIEKWVDYYRNRVNGAQRPDQK